MNPDPKLPEGKPGGGAKAEAKGAKKPAKPVAKVAKPVKPRGPLGRLFGWVLSLVGLLLRLVVGAVCALIVYLGICAFLAQSAPYPNEQAGLYVPKGMVAGAYHVHSTESDGRGSVWEIAQAAKHAGLSFVVLTDHNLKKPQPPHFEDGVLVIHGTEESTAFGHLVELGAERGLADGELHKDPIQQVAKLGGLSFIAHPVQQKNPWTDWNATGRASGVELYSGDTMLREALREPFSRLLPALGAYLTNPAHAMMSMVAEQPETTRRLLEMNEKAPRAALCALDAHGFPSYESEFKVLAHYLPVKDGLPEDAREAGKFVIQSLAQGDGYCVFRPLGDIGEFSIEGLEAPRRAKVGTALKVMLPATDALEVRLKVTGPATVDSDGRTVKLLKPGPVQLEIWRRAPGFLGSEFKPWIVPSPIIVHP